MTRPLLLTAACGYAVALVCLIGAFSLGGGGWVPWAWSQDGHGDWNMDGWGGHRGGRAIDGGGPRTERILAWAGDDELHIHVPGRITYTQGPEAGIKVIGPKGAVEHLVMSGDTLKFDRRVRTRDDLQIAITAPSVSKFGLKGAQELTIVGYAQDRLELQVAGAAEVKATGRAREVEIHSAGASEIDLGDVVTDTAEIHIAGVGEAILSPKITADINIAGAGEVTLTTNPPNLDTHIVGPGRLVRRSAPEAPTADKSKT